MEKSLNKNIKKLQKTFVFICFLLISSCFNRQVKFNKVLWDKENISLFYTERKKMTNDLIKNVLNENICQDSIVNLLGNHFTFDTLEYKMFYPVDSKYKFLSMDIDPIWVKYLEITLDEDYCFIQAKLIKNRDYKNF